ncbi:MAG: acetolactate synthase small subunit [Clostridia bacterium]|nr:acetolactate synthase small subunit [Clostridia bacterium]
MADEKQSKYIIGALVSNRAGVLTKITGLFARRAYNIESLTVCTTEDPDISRMTIILIGTEYNMYQMIKQMDKLEDVMKIGCANELNCVYRELMLAKVNADPRARAELFQIAEVYKAHIVDLSTDTLVLELTGDGEKLDAFTEVIRPYGILEMQRTGTCALARGRHVLKDRDCYSDHIF